MVATMDNKPEISVVIPALNEEKYITHVLDGLQNQTFKDFEVIVSDNGSTDGTVKVANSYPNVKVVVEKRRGISINRNTGARSAIGKNLVFLDADTKPSERLLESYYNAFKDESIIAATGPIYPLEKTKMRVDLGFKLVSVLFVRLSILLGRPSVVGLNFAVRKDAFQEVGGFNESFATYEDWDLSLRLRKKGRISYVNNALVYTSVRRIKNWGMHGFFFFHVGNILRYHFLKKPKEEYELIR
jgi:glycosyltransferase involved in cell wall biosynthesis